MNIEEFGFTKEELQNRIVDRICEHLLGGGSDDAVSSNEFEVKMTKLIQERIGATVQALAEKYVLPNVQDYIEKLTLVETNKWGERTGKSLTFIEYLIQRAEAYMLEDVNYEGKPKGTDSYSWTKYQTRLTHLVHQHLHFHIERAMKEALTIANSTIAKGIEETVKIKLQEVTNGLKVSATIK